MHVLVVDDDAAICAMAKSLLTRHEIDTSTKVATTLDDALGIIQEGAHDAIVLDLGLPDSTGLDTLNAVLHAAPEVPVIVLSGTQDPTTIKSALRAGAEDFIVKDQAGLRTLAVRVENAVTRRSSSAHLEEGHRIHARDELVRNFLNEANHELRTPLTSIGVAQMMLRQNDLNEEGRARLSRSLARLKETIEDFLGVLSQPTLQDVAVQEVLGHAVLHEGHPLRVVGNDQALTRAFKAIHRIAGGTPAITTQDFPGDRVRIRLSFEADEHPEGEHPVLLALIRQHLEQSMGHLAIRYEDGVCRLDITLSRSLKREPWDVAARAL